MKLFSQCVFAITLGCGSYDLKIWQDLSPVSPLLPMPIRGHKSVNRERERERPLLFSPKVFEKKMFVHDYRMVSAKVELHLLHSSQLTLELDRQL